ncbi:MAG: hypothetical protein ACFFAU_18540 [Candidatus Hodarchaeota archaeon]
MLALKENLIQEKRSIGIGIIIYFLSLAIACSILIGCRIIFGGLFLGSLPLYLLFADLILSFPAIPSTYITSYLSKKQYVGFQAVLVSGLIIISLISIIVGIILLGELVGPPPMDHYEDLGRRMIFLSFFFFYLFIIFPITMLSGVFAVLTELVSTKYSPSRSRSPVKVS